MIRDYLMTVPAGGAKEMSIVGSYFYMVEMEDNKLIRLNGTNEQGSTVVDLLVQQSSEFRTTENFNKLRFINDGNTDLNLRYIAGSGDYAVDSTPPIQTVSLGAETVAVSLAGEEVAVVSGATPLAVEQVQESRNIVGLPGFAVPILAGDSTIIPGNPNRKRLVVRAGASNDNFIWICTNAAGDASVGIPLFAGDVFDEYVTGDIRVSADAGTTRWLFMYEVV